MTDAVTNQLLTNGAPAAVSLKCLIGFCCDAHHATTPEDGKWQAIRTVYDRSLLENDESCTDIWDDCIVHCIITYVELGSFECDSYSCADRQRNTVFRYIFWNIVQNFWYEAPKNYSVSLVDEPQAKIFHKTITAGLHHYMDESQRN